jgi:hypothetical protein
MNKYVNKSIKKKITELTPLFEFLVLSGSAGQEITRLLQSPVIITYFTGPCLEPHEPRLHSHTLL